MKKRVVLTVILVVAILVAVVGIIIVIRNNEQPKLTPLPGLENLYLITIDNNSYVNVTQGTTLPINVTFTSSTNQPIEIPIENLSLSTYTSVINPKVWTDYGQNSSVIPNNICTYNFSLNTVLL